MMEIKISTGNEAFRNPYTGDEDKEMEAKEVVRILSMIQTQLNHGYRDGICHDLNGNKVGIWSLK